MSVFLGKIKLIFSTAVLKQHWKYIGSELTHKRLTNTLKITRNRLKNNGLNKVLKTIKECEKLKGGLTIFFLNFCNPLFCNRFSVFSES